MDTRGQYGNRAGLKDEFGNPIQQTTGAYGNPLPSHEGTGLHGTTGVGVGGKPQMTHPVKERRDGGILHRSGSSSSSSSEDDGMGGRRKKGLKEKIKEKLPGGRKTDEQGQGQGYGHVPITTGPGTGYGGTTTGPATGYGGTTTATTGTAGHNDPEKKGFMGKIKENLPGGRKTDEQGPGQGYGHVPITTGPGTGYGGTTTGPATGYGGTTTATTGTAGHNDPEKKGFMGKIKEKLPGHQ